MKEATNILRKAQKRDEHQVMMPDGPKTVETLHRRGLYAVHHNPETEDTYGGYVVTHAPTGLRVSSVPDHKPVEGFPNYSLGRAKYLADVMHSYAGDIHKDADFGEMPYQSDHDVLQRAHNYWSRTNRGQRTFWTPRDYSEHLGGKLGSAEFEMLKDPKHRAAGWHANPVSYNRGHDPGVAPGHTPAEHARAEREGYKLYMHHYHDLRGSDWRSLNDRVKAVEMKDHATDDRHILHRNPSYVEEATPAVVASRQLKHLSPWQTTTVSSGGDISEKYHQSLKAGVTNLRPGTPQSFAHNHLKLRNTAITNVHYHDPK